MSLSELSVRRTRSICVICCGLIAALVAFGQSASTAAGDGSGAHRPSSGVDALHISSLPDGTDRLAVGKADRLDASVDVERGSVRPVPRNPIVIHHVAHPDGTQDILEPNGRNGGPPYEKLIYSNTGGSSIWVPGTIGLQAGDDWSTISVDGCPMTSYSVTVNGGGDGEESFMAYMVLYDGCPSAGGEQIPGTWVLFEDLDDDERFMHELTLAFDPPLDIPQTVWASVAFNSTTAGWVFDSAPELGFSADAFWLPTVTNECDAYFGGAPPHGSFGGQVWAADGMCSGFSQDQCSIDEDCVQDETCQGGCPTHFLAYSTAVGAGGPQIFPPGANQPTRVGDDFMLTVTDCELSSYELGVRAIGGPFTIDIDLRPNGFPGPYPGTERTLSGLGDGRLEIMRATFPEGGIFIDQYAMMTWQPSRSNIGAINARRTLAVGPVEDFYPPDIDTPGQYYWLLDAPTPEGWTRYDTLAGEPAIFHIVINCKGTAPRGACCPAQFPGRGVTCFDDTTVLECLGSRWKRDVTCAENAFDPPCGTHACCTPDDDCSDLFFEECEAVCEFIDDEERCGIWGSGTFCGGDGQFCPLFVCTFATGDCLSGTACANFDCLCTTDEQCQDEFGLGPTSNCIEIAGGFHVCTPRRGCNNIRCCDSVCRADFFCCETAWGSACVDAAIGLSDTACGCVPVNYASSVPNSGPIGDDTIHWPGTLWRTTKNVIRITLDGPAFAAPNAADIQIRELQDGGAFGPDLSASFDFSMEDGTTVLRIADTGSTIEHQKWYAIINTGWYCVAPFERHYASAYGDGNGEGLVQFADLAFINAAINSPVSGDADRHDINGDNLIQFADLAAANATMHLHAIPKPTGH